MTMVDYGRSLSAVSEHGPAAFYTGALGAGIVSELQANGGFLPAADLAGYRVVERAPPIGAYPGRPIATQLGQAPRRERGCTYVYISVCAGSLQKQIDTTIHY